MTGELRSHRYVTSGYRNVFHRAFLYGLGLSRDDMDKPFCGLAVAHHEAAPGQASVRAVADLTRLGLAAVGITEREFVVPESLGSAQDAVEARELVADSAELVVRGHWYDALVGVAASVPAVMGLAGAIARLRVPGLVVVPADRVERTEGLAESVDLLGRLGIGAAVDADDRQALQSHLAGVLEQIRDGASIVDGAGRIRGAVTRPTSGSQWSHLCALAHELGIADAAELCGEARSMLAWPGGQAEVLGVLPVGEVSLTGAEQGVDLSWAAGATATVAVPERVAECGEQTVAVAVGDQAWAALVAAVRGGTTTGTATAVGDAATSDAVTSVQAIAGVDHPGLVDSYLNYDRF